jgi:hypothetical protein
MKLSLCLIEHYASKKYGGVDVKIHDSLNSVLVRGEWSVLCHSRFSSPGKGPLCQLDKMLGSPQSWSGRYGQLKILDLNGTQLRSLGRSSSPLPVAIPTSRDAVNVCLCKVF